MMMMRTKMKFMMTPDPPAIIQYYFRSSQGISKTEAAVRGPERPLAPPPLGLVDKRTTNLKKIFLKKSSFFPKLTTPCDCIKCLLFLCYWIVFPMKHE